MAMSCFLWPQGKGQEERNLISSGTFRLILRKNCQDNETVDAS